MRAQETGCAAAARRPRAQRRGGVPPAHRLGHRGRGPARGDPPQRISVGHHRRLRPRPRARPGCPLGAAAQRGAASCCARRVAARTGAGADAARRATPPGWPATAAVRRPCAPSATGPCASADPPARRSAPGAPPRRPGWPAPSAAVRGCAPRCSATRAPPRSSAGPSPGCTVRSSSSGDRVLAEVDDTPAIVVATPGAEPVARGGYAAVLLLDTWLLLAPLRPARRPRRRCAAGPTPPRWCVRPATVGQVLAVGDAVAPGAAGAGALGPQRPGPPRDRRAAVGAPAAGLAGRHRHRRARRPRGRPLPALQLPARCGGARPGPGREPGTRRDERAGALRRPRPAQPPAPPSPPRSARCRPSARRASCRTSASRSTRPSSG